MTASRDDFDDLAALWAEDPASEEQVELVGLAQRVSWRAMLFHYWDLGLGLAIAAAVLLAVLMKPAPVTLAIGMVAAGGLSWSTWKRHLLKKQVALLLEVSERTQLLDLQIRRVTTDLHRAVVTLVAMPPALVLFGMLTHSLTQGGSVADLTEAVTEKFFSAGLIGPALVAAMLTLILQQVQIVRRLRSELRRLRILSGEYRDEAQLDRIAVG